MSRTSESIDVRLARRARDVRIAQVALERALEERRREMARAAVAGYGVRAIGAMTGLDFSHVAYELRRVRAQAEAQPTRRSA